MNFSLFIVGCRKGWRCGGRCDKSGIKIVEKGGGGGEALDK